MTVDTDDIGNGHKGGSGDVERRVKESILVDQQISLFDFNAKIVGIVKEQLKIPIFITVLVTLTVVSLGQVLWVKTTTDRIVSGEITTQLENREKDFKNIYDSLVANLANDLIEGKASVISIQKEIEDLKGKLSSLELQDVDYADINKKITLITQFDSEKGVDAQTIISEFKTLSQKVASLNQNTEGTGDDLETLNRRVGALNKMVEEEIGKRQQFTNKLNEIDKLAKELKTFLKPNLTFEFDTENDTTDNLILKFIAKDKKTVLARFTFPGVKNGKSKIPKHLGDIEILKETKYLIVTTDSSNGWDGSFKIFVNGVLHKSYTPNKKAAWSGKPWTLDF